MKIAKETWDDTQAHKWAGFSIMQKLKAIKLKLKVWNKEEFGDVNEALKTKENDLHAFDLLVEERQLSSEHKAARYKANSEFWKLSRLIETLWGDRSQGLSG